RTTNLTTRGMVTILRGSRQSVWLKLQRIGEVGLATGLATLLVSVAVVALTGPLGGAAVADTSNCAPTHTATASASASASASPSTSPSATPSSSASASPSNSAT